ncbi:MAG: biotin/lipoyl-binding protein [Bacteroidales bacterium]|nr:biotin/lipoyl-binding protein [Bacteroidales bacterium]MCI5619401.1 biotin/lipoyl-binding protein [Rikenellaceae bacterium]
MKEYKFKINGNDYTVAINSIEGNIADVTVNGAAYKVEMENAPAVAAAPAPISAAPAVQAAPAAAAPAPAPAGAAKVVEAPLPGVIIEVSVKEGQAVKAGQKVAVLEAMKMENEIQAECDGTVTAIHVAKGDQVVEGSKLISIA